MTSSCQRLIIGCGYLGLRVARHWKQAGYKTVVTTRSAERAESLRAEGFEAVVCNVLEPASLRALPAAGVVLHAVGYDRTSGQSQRDVYVNGLQHVLTELQNRCQRFLHISSTSVYGQSEGELVDETSPTEPSRENGKIVREAEQRVEQADCDWHILRLAGIYGPNRLLARQMERERALPIPGNPDAWLNLIHVTDCVSAVSQAASLPEQREMFLISDDRPLRRREYYETLAQLLNAPAPVFVPEQADPKGDRGYNKRCQNTKMHALLLKTLQFPTIQQGLPDALDV